ncbi:MAG: hypothetical protein M3O34_13055 [Chloroflexota bacterium]|nr:hypothetical protein [Chloroflexota bacterium]
MRMTVRQVGDESNLIAAADLRSWPDLVARSKSGVYGAWSHASESL